MSRPRHPRTIKLHRLMTAHSLDGPTVAHLLSRSLKTVHCWRSESPAPIPEALLELLEFKVHFAHLNTQVKEA